MLSLPASIRIFVARDAVDLRKAHDGLLAVIRDAFGDDPFDGSLFVFVNRSRDRVKLLQWDRDGFWLHYKRLEQGTFKLDVKPDASRCEISRAQLAMLIEGIDLQKQKIRQPLSRPVRRGDRDGRVATSLPDDVEMLKALLIAQQDAIASRDTTIAQQREQIRKLEHNVEVFRRIAFGRGSEKRGNRKLAEGDTKSRQLHLWLTQLVEEADRTAEKTGAHGTIDITPKQPDRGRWQDGGGAREPVADCASRRPRSEDLLPRRATARRQRDRRYQADAARLEAALRAGRRRPPRGHPLSAARSLRSREVAVAIVTWVIRKLCG